MGEGGGAREEGQGRRGEGGGARKEGQKRGMRDERIDRRDVSTIYMCTNTDTIMN